MNFVALEMPIGDRAEHIGIYHGDRSASIMCAIIADIAILTELKPW